MRFIEFSKRNIKEILREPLSIIFMLILPVVLFIVLEVMFKSIGSIEQTPQFKINQLTASMIIFSFTFLTIFVGNTLAKDREEKFLLRLKSTPMKAYDFVLGYTLAIIPFALIQEIVIIITGLFFGLEFNFNLLLLIVCLLPTSFIFIGFGILFGSICSTKGVGGVASIIPTASSLLGGMFFPLDLMTGGFKNLCMALPFANSIGIGKYIIGEPFSNLSSAIVICIIYTFIIYSLSVFIFTYKLKNDSI